MKPLGLARPLLAVGVLVMQCSGLFPSMLPAMCDFFPRFHCIDVSCDLCVGVISALLGEDQKPGIFCSRFSVGGDVVDAGCFCSVLFSTRMAFSCQRFVLFGGIPLLLVRVVGVGVFCVRAYEVHGKNELGKLNELGNG